MSNEPVSDQPRSLVQVCDTMLTLILSLQGSNGLKDVATLQAQVQAQYAEIQSKAAQASIDKGNIDLASFALAAFADEAISRSGLANRTTWPFLQYTYFRTHRAGERFFENLQKIRGDAYDPAIWKNPKMADLLELYYLCLLLGYQGEWEFSTPQQVQHDMDEIQQHIRSKPVGSLSPNIAPKAYDDVIRRQESRWKWGAIALYLVLMVTLVLISVYWPQG